MLAYHVELTPDDNETLLVLCPSLPMVASFGATREEALLHARDAIETALASMIADGEIIPLADTAGTLVRLPMLTTLKVELYRALRESGMTRADLTRRLGWKRESVDRLFRLDHASRLEQIEAAMAAVGKAFDVEVLAAA
ncbi:type II toxin-antitoxin system HicB family antitoxin [Bosea vaviloviae]|uniref:Transcriptional regulator n=1 Tax=Bosea vaviloviae TaxID=1526658 RepID=A0A1D7TY36_9HYPH|nr:type II toxin-antitoxin system HicB family antitoxin [Bosea vaviloviae]AOO80026.1 transcriptional regulator [Bosea vaviloviae]